MIPRGLRIDRKNRPIFEFALDHPARGVLVAHGQCWRDCAGREIPWPGRESEAYDQSWSSSTDDKRWTFSGFIYCYICRSYVFEGWINRPPHMTLDEQEAIENLPWLQTLMRECRAAAIREDNKRVLPRIDQTERFLELWGESVRLRLKEDRIVVHS